MLLRSAAGNGASFPASQADLGAMVNAGRKQVNAVLKRFAAAGWVARSYRSTTVIDPAALRGFVASGEEG